MYTVHRTYTIYIHLADTNKLRQLNYRGMYIVHFIYTHIQYT